MGDIHLHILLYDLVKGRLWHPLDILQSGIQIHDRSKTEIALSNIDSALFTGEIVDIGKEGAMDAGEGSKGTGLQTVQGAGFKQLQRTLLAELFLHPGQF